jgi:hypothetical protein
MPQDGQAQVAHSGIRDRETVRAQDCQPDSMSLVALQEMQSSNR